jgi:hypothetical protein
MAAPACEPGKPPGATPDARPKPAVTALFQRAGDVLRCRLERCTLPPEARVIIDDPPSMSLLGLLLGSIIARQADRPETIKRLERLRGAMVVEAGTMTITLQFADGKVTILRGAVEGARARVRGSMEALLNISLGKGMVGPWLTGRIKTRGSLIMLLKVLPLMRA